MASWLELEDLLVERLKAELAPGIKVQTARDLAGVLENGQASPGVQIYHSRYTPTQEQAAGAVQEVEQSWIAVVVVRNAATQLTGAAARNAASPICDAVLNALLGHKPGKDFTPLKLTSAPGAAWSKGGFGYYPLGFTSRLTVRGKSQTRTP